MKKLIAILLCCSMLVGVVGCANTTSNQSTSDQPTSEQSQAVVTETTGTEASTTSTAVAAEEPEKDIDQIYGLSPDGKEATLASSLELTDEDIEKIKAGNFKVAICMHQMDNSVNNMKVAVMKEVFESYGVEVITVTDGQSKVEQMVSNLETAISMKPDLIISIAYDVNAMVPIFEQVRDAGIKLVFFECAPTGFVPGEDYYALVSTDYFGSGRFAAEYMAYLLNYEGTVGMIYLDADVWTCNQRDQAFRDVIAKYPNMKIVAQSGFASASEAGTAADAMLASYPDIDGIYTTWDTPADDVMASAASAGRDDLIITTVDLGENAARVIAEDGMIKAVGAARSYEDGQTIAKAAIYALIDKELENRYIATPTQGVSRENVLDAYANCYNTNPSDEIINIWEKAYNTTWKSPLN